MHVVPSLRIEDGEKTSPLIQGNSFCIVYPILKNCQNHLFSPRRVTKKSIYLNTIKTWNNMFFKKKTWCLLLSLFTSTDMIYFFIEYNFTIL